MVADALELSGSDTGTGIGVNQILRNVNWVAIPDATSSSVAVWLQNRRSIQPSTKLRSEQRPGPAGSPGVKIKEHVMRQRPAAMPAGEFVVRNSIGTHLSLNFARTAYCARLPMSRAANTNNCSHVVHNALAAADLWDAKQARGPGLINVAKDILSVAKGLALGRMSDEADRRGHRRLQESRRGAHAERRLDGHRPRWRRGAGLPAVL